MVRVCGRVNNFYLFFVYRSPAIDDSVYDCLLLSMSSIQSTDPKAAFLVVGDFNAHHREWLQSVSPTDVHGRAALDFCTLSNCEQIVRGPTHNAGNLLDLAMTDTPDLVKVRICPPLGSSDHNCVRTSLQVEQVVSVPDSRRVVYLKSRAEWNGLLGAVLQFPWSRILASHDPVVELDRHTATAIERFVPKSTLLLRSRDKPWFDVECRRAFDAKQEAYHSW
jgi:hypothetical protein